MAKRKSGEYTWIKLVTNLLAFDEATEIMFINKNQGDGAHILLIYILLCGYAANRKGALVNWKNGRLFPMSPDEINREIFKYAFSNNEIDAALAILTEYNFLSVREIEGARIMFINGMYDAYAPLHYESREITEIWEYPTGAGTATTRALQQKSRKNQKQLMQSHSVSENEQINDSSQIISYTEIMKKAGMQSKSSISNYVKKLELEQHVVSIGKQTKGLPLKQARYLIDVYKGKKPSKPYADDEGMDGSMDGSVDGSVDGLTVHDGRLTVHEPSTKRLKNTDKQSVLDGYTNLCTNVTQNDARDIEYKNKYTYTHGDSTDSNPYIADPEEFLEALQHGTKVNKTEKGILEDLQSNTNFSNELINTLIEYVLSVSNNQLIPKFVDMISGEWSRAGIATREEALAYIEKSEEEKKKKNATKRSSRKSSTSDYVKMNAPDYIIQQMNGTLPEGTKASKEEIEHIKELQAKMKD